MKQEYAQAYEAMPESKDVKKKPVIEVSNEIDNGDIKEQYTIKL
jgi:hypothetical protein